MAEARRRFAAAIVAGNWPAALRFGEAAVAEAPDDASLAYNLALVLRRLGRDADALPLLERLVSSNPAHQGAAFELAALRMDLGHYEAAWDAFLAYLGRHGEDADAWLNLGRLALRTGRAGEARGAFARCRALRPEDAEPLIGEAEARRELGEGELAEDLLRRLFVSRPALRPRLLRVLTQGRTGRLPLRVSGLLGR